MNQQESNYPLVFQDGVSITFARREADESRKAEESSPDLEGKYPVLVVEGANHAQVSDGE